MSPTTGRLSVSALCLIACMGSAHGEAVEFRSAAVPPTPLQVRLAQERGVTAPPHPGDLISAELYRPAGEGPYPAVIALHGCGGRVGAFGEGARAAHFTAAGYAVLAVDSFAARGIHEECNGAVSVANDRISDAYGALDWLVAQRFVIASRIALAGYSQGANVAFAIASGNDHTPRTEHAKFAAAILYYPHCFAEDAAVVIPALILVGELDDWTPARYCTDMVARRTGAGATERLIVYPGARHAFDAVGLKDRPRVTYGHHLAYDATADRAAAQAANEFLAEWMKP